MMLEHALLSIRVGEEPAFEESMREALPLIESAEGCLAPKCAVRPKMDRSTFLLVRWSSIDAHLSFRETELFTAWRALTHRYYREVPVVTHFHEPLTY